MPNIKSAAKQMRQSAKRRLRNRTKRSALRTSVKCLDALIAAGDAPAAQAQLPATLSIIGKSAQKGLIHQNKAARNVSRLTRKVNAMGVAAASTEA